MDFEAVAAEWIRELRGKRSQSAFSRRLGYASSVVQRWESGASWPTASRFLEACRQSGKDVAAAYASFFRCMPSWLKQYGATSPPAVAAFLRQLRGKTRIGSLAESSGYSRYSIARWLKAEAEPRLPEFLRLVEASSRRTLDFIATLHDPDRLPSAHDRWARLQRMREAAYETIWSHAVLRALELEEYDRTDDVIPWLAGVLGIGIDQVAHALGVLERAGQITGSGSKWAVLPATAVATGRDPATRGVLTRAWARVAGERLDRRAPGHFGYSLFAVSRSDMKRLRELHVAYFREMQSVIAQSKPNECVGLLCVQLLDLREGEENALGDEF